MGIECMKTRNVKNFSFFFIGVKKEATLFHIRLSMHFLGFFLGGGAQGQGSGKSMRVTTTSTGKLLQHHSCMFI